MEEGEKMKIKFECIFSGHNIKQNGIVQLKLKAPEEEIHNILSLVTCIGKEIKVAASIGTEKIKIGKFFVDKITIDKNAQATITIVSTIESIDCSVLPSLSKKEQIINIFINCE